MTARRIGDDQDLEEGYARAFGGVWELGRLFSSFWLLLDGKAWSKGPTASPRSYNILFVYFIANFEAKG